MSTVVILGAGSPIARALARRFLERGHAVHLAARDAEEVRRIASDLAIRTGGEVRSSTFDATRPETHRTLVDEVLRASAGAIEGVVLAFGTTGDLERARHDPAHVREIVEVNLGAAAALLTAFADALEARRRGFIVGLSSVAGDRGRQSNYVYGAAKAGLTILLQGLRNRLTPAGVHVLTVKLGFVDTRMTFGKAGVFAAASPEAVADAIVAALDRHLDEVYLPRFWRGIMAAIRAIPEPLFKRLKL
ncbi:MAG: SDR family oxidoreductase [Deltaproteobacteria bacterium]|nr:MAG: SDR family oxidoreductase [Deltaproteobacteria bacterium]